MASPWYKYIPYKFGLTLKKNWTSINSHQFDSYGVPYFTTFDKSKQVSNFSFKQS